MEFTKGGKGKRAPYTTIHYRIPEPIKPLVERLANGYKTLLGYERSTDELLNQVEKAIASSVYPSDEKVVPSKSEDISRLQAYIDKLEAEAREQKHRCIHLENENNRLTRLGQDYSQETVARLSNKYTKALSDIQHWKESSERYQRQAAKLRADNEILSESLEVKERELELFKNCSNQHRIGLDLLNSYLNETGDIPLDEKGKPKARYDQLAKFKKWLSERE